MHTEVSITAATALQVRAMAVCSAWRDCLDPRKWPIETLELDGLDDDDERLLPWIISTRPAVKSLDLSNCKTPQLLTVLASVPRMVSSAVGAAVVCTVPALAPMTALEELGVSGWGREGGPLLPRITQLHLGITDSVVVNTALPSLQELSVYMVSSVVLGGQHFQAPRLSSLLLHEVDKDMYVSWGQLGGVKELQAHFMGEATLLGAAELSALTNIAALSLGCSQGQGASDAAHALLQAAPTSLRSLTLEGWPAEELLPPTLTELTQLTTLQCGGLAIVSQLSSLQHLHSLHLRGHPAASLSVPELAMLSEFSSLRRLRFLEHQIEAGVWACCLKVLQAVLPRGCQVERGAWKPF
ncbi:hypothetical protein N2152v2_009687 [Parachlorella kessleri]